jgi:histidinol-phosphate aminotransferase
VSDLDLGPLAARVPEVLRAATAYHVPQPPQLRAKLDANEMPYPLPAELRARLGAVLAEVALERYPDPRARELRAVIAKQQRVGEDQLVFGNGSDELIAILMSAFPGPVLYPTPSFVYYKLSAIARGLPTVEVPLGLKFELDEVALAREVADHKPSLVFLALPNNPTGTLWRMDFALELAAAHRDTVIVSDEAYFAYCGKTNLSQLAAHPNLVVMRTLSKVGLAGLRVGFTITSRAIAHLLEKLRPPYNVSSLDQRAAVFLVEEAAHWRGARVAEVIAERGRLAGELAKYGEVFASEANLLLVKFTRPVAAALATRGISVRDFPFGTRVTVGTPDENALLLAALAECGV